MRLPYLLDSGLDVVVAGGLVEAAGEVNHRNVRGGHSERHARQLAVQLGYNLVKTNQRQVKTKKKQKRHRNQKGVLRQSTDTDPGNPLSLRTT